MESKSSNNPSRRQRGQRSDGGNRNPQGRNRQNRGGGRNRRTRQGSSAPQNARSGRQRSRRPSPDTRSKRARRKSAPKRSTASRILSVLTFGLLGVDAKRGSRGGKPAAKGKKSAARQSAGATPAEPRRKRARRHPDPTSGRLYVGNLDYAATEHDLEDLFKGIGIVLSAEVVTHSRTQQSKGFAFVEMGSADEAGRAIEILDDEMFLGRRLTVKPAREEDSAEDSGRSPESADDGEGDEAAAAGEDGDAGSDTVGAPAGAPGRSGF